jgi:hypothetical protein
MTPPGCMRLRMHARARLRAPRNGLARSQLHKAGCQALAMMIGGETPEWCGPPPHGNDLQYLADAPGYSTRRLRQPSPLRPPLCNKRRNRASTARSIRSARQRPLLSVGVRRRPLPSDAYPQRQDKCDINHIEGYGCGLPGQPCRSQPACWTGEQVEAQAGVESQEGSAGSARSGTREAV